jgi:hypothetical protein
MCCLSLEWTSANVLSLYWSDMEYIPNICASIGQIWSMFPTSVLLLVTGNTNLAEQGEKVGLEVARVARRLSEHCAMSCPSIGQIWSTFPTSLLLLVRYGVYSQHLSLYWSDMEYIPNIRASIGYRQTDLAEQGEEVGLEVTRVARRLSGHSSRVALVVHQKIAVQIQVHLHSFH